MKYKHISHHASGAEEQLLLVLNCLYHYLYPDLRCPLFSIPDKQEGRKKLGKT